MKKLTKKLKNKRILIVNCYFDELRVPIRRRLKAPHSMTPAYLAGLFSAKFCEIKLYDEIYSGPLDDERILAFPDMVVLTGLNTSFDRMLHITAYARTKNSKVVVVAGGPAIRALPLYSKNFFDYCCTGDIEQLSEVIEDVFGRAYVSESFRQSGWVIPRYDLVYWTKVLSYVESSRNCYYRCSYCSLTAEKGRYQSYEIEYLRQQFMVLGKQKFVHFLDNNFASQDRKFLVNRFGLLRDLWREGYFYKWTAEVTSDFFLNDENLKLACDSGCGALFSGVESFDKQSLLNFKKYQNTNLPQVQMIRNCLDAGIAFHYGILLDLTTRPIAELKDEVDFIVGNSEITLPSYLSVVIPLLGSPYFHECLKQELFLPNVKLRDLDGSTINLKPLDSITHAAQFIRDIQTLRGYKLKVVRRVREFHRRYKNVVSGMNMVSAQYNAVLLCVPKLANVGIKTNTLPLNGFKKQPRTFIGSTEPLDPVYKPAFSVASHYRDYFKPTMLTDQHGNLVEALHQDLLQN